MINLPFNIILFMWQFSLIYKNNLLNTRMDSKYLALLLVLVTAATIGYRQVNGINNEDITRDINEFQLWKSKHKTSFASVLENAYREKIFLQNKLRIAVHNAKKEKTYEMGLNQFSALTDDEFQQQYLGLIYQQNNLNVQSTNSDQLTISVGEVDWTSQGAVTDVKNQGQCGSCWAFSATGSLEGLSKISYGELKSFSEQQLVDCSGSYGNQACNGGLMDNAFKFVHNKGIVLQSQYPYKGVKQTCSKATGSFKISGFVDVKTCNQLAIAVSARPVSVAVDATNWSRYSSGVFDNCASRLNHGVLLVGVSDQYWKVKNSWGTTWGESGFIRLTKGNTCGICNAASYPKK